MAEAGGAEVDGDACRRDEVGSGKWVREEGVQECGKEVDLLGASAICIAVGISQRRRKRDW